MVAIHQPYPYNYRDSGLPKIVGVYFAVIFLFLWLFQPFQVNPEEQKVSYVVICIVHALAPALLFYIYFLALNMLLPVQRTEKWTVGNEILHLCILFFLFGLVSFLLRDVIYTNPDNWSWYYFVEEVKNTFLAGSLISSMLILLNFYRLSISTRKHADVVNSHLPAVMLPDSDQVSMKTNVKSDDFTLHLNDFLFARAEGNYLEVYCVAAVGIKKELKRMTLSQLEDQLHSFRYIIRCHRAYVVNTRRIQHVTGNAQGYVLSFSATTEQVPVSRSKISAFDKVMN